MKIEFRKGDEPQRAVSQAQVEMRKAKSRKWPLFKTFVFMVILCAIGYGYWNYSRLDTIYTYGMVSAEIELFKSPHQGVLQNMNLKRGFHVEKDSILFTLVPVLSDKEKQAEQDVIDGYIETQKSDAASLASDVDRAKGEAARLKAIYDEDQLRQEYGIRAAEIEVAKLKSFLDAKKARYDKLVNLYKMDAALESDVNTSKNEVQLAVRNLEKANLDLDQVIKRTLPSKAAFEKALLEVEIAKKSQGKQSSQGLDQAKFELTVAMKNRDPIEFRAPSDGVVVEVSAVDGSMINAGQMIASISAEHPLWVDAFIPVKQSVRLKEGDEALIYVPGMEEPIRGTIAAEKGTAIRVPEILRYRLPKINMAAYVRIAIDDTYAGTVLPGSEVRVVITGKILNSIG